MVVVVVRKVIIVSVHVRYFSFFSFFSLSVRLCRLHQVTSVYVGGMGRGARQQGQDRGKTGTRHGDYREKKEIRQKQVNKRQGKDRDKIREEEGKKVGNGGGR